MPLKTAKAAYEAVCRVEEKWDLLRHCVAGWSVWPTIRFQIARALYAAPFTSSLLSRASRVRLAASDLRRLVVLPQAENVVVTYSSGLLDPDNGRFRDIWFDDIEVLRGAFRVERVNNPAFLSRRKKALVPSDVTSAMVDQWVGLMSRRPSPPEVERAAEAIAEAVAELPITVGEEWVARRLRYFYWAVAAYRSLLRRLAPRNLVVADCSEHAFIAAAKELGIRTFELQHGISDRYHAGYAWTKYAVPFKKKMPVPDRVLLYGEHWRKELDGEGGFWQSELRVVGSPRLDRYRRQVPSGGHDRFRIVVTGQGFFGSEVAAFLLEVLRRVPDVEIVVKLHPVFGSDKALYDAVLGNRSEVTVLRGNEGPSTFKLLAEADLHVSISSASHYDALGLGVPTVILGVKMADVVDSLRRSGHAEYASSPEELAAIVAGQRGRRVPEDVREYYFRSGSAANIAAELGE